MKFFVARAGIETGQFEQAEFEEKIRTREILPTDHFWSEGMTDWLLVLERRPSAPAPRKRRRRPPAPMRPLPGDAAAAGTTTR